MKDIINLEFNRNRNFTVPHLHTISQRQAQALWRCNRAAMRDSALGYLAALSPSRKKTLAERVEYGAFFLRLAMRYRTLAPSPRQSEPLSPA